MLREFTISTTIIAICVVVHALGLSLVGNLLLNHRETLQRFTVIKSTIALVGVFAAMMVLHVVETGIWAGFYSAKSLFPNAETSLYFSLESYTTIGYGDVVLPEGWRLLGTLEGASAVLLFGLSTAFIFVVLAAMFRIYRDQRSD
jgi:hypothetical protein